MGLRVGVTIFARESDGIAFWSNGAHQNVVYLWLMLRHCESVDAVYLVNMGDGDPPPVESLPRELHGIAFARIDDVIGELDVLIQAGAQVSAEHVATVQRNGGRAVSFKFGNDLCINAESAIHDLPAASIFNGSRFDEVWTTDQHAHTCGSYWETCYRCPVRVLPHVWSPMFVDQSLSCFPANLPRKYDPSRATGRVAVYEPNINWAKTCHVPMLVAERAYRKRPDLVRRVMVTNAIHMRERLPFTTFANALDIQHVLAADGAPIVSFEPRYQTPWFTAAHADVVVSHQWLDTPTYLHYDVLHMGWPLVHNITGMPGYFYPGFDAGAGGDALVRAMSASEEGHAEYVAQARTFVASRLADAPKNIEAHDRALRELMVRPARAAA